MSRNKTICFKKAINFLNFQSQPKGNEILVLRAHGTLDMHLIRYKKDAHIITIIIEFGRNHMENCGNVLENIAQLTKYGVLFAWGNKFVL